MNFTFRLLPVGKLVRSSGKTAIKTTTAKVWCRFASNVCLVLRVAQEAGAEVVRCMFKGCSVGENIQLMAGLMRDVDVFPIVYILT